MGDIGFSELVVIVIIAILVYGKDLPQAARKMASIYSKFRRQLTDIKDEISRQIPAEEIKNEFQKDFSTGIEPPSMPYNLSASPAEGRVHLSWDYAPGATGYTVKRTKDRLEPYSTLAMSIPDLSYTDADVTPGQTWYYVVSAQNSAGESGDSNDVEAVIAGSPASPAPAPEAAGNGGPSPAPAPEAPPPPSPPVGEQNPAPAP
jgi:Tat protein translocase TatB subunit